jgi:hypothetical protein
LPLLPHLPVQPFAPSFFFYLDVVFNFALQPQQLEFRLVELRLGLLLAVLLLLPDGANGFGKRLVELLLRLGIARRVVAVLQRQLPLALCQPAQQGTTRSDAHDLDWMFSNLASLAARL